MHRVPRSLFGFAWLGVVLAVGTSGVLFGAEKKLPQVPEGFSIEVVAGAPLVKHPMMASFDDRGRLFVAESAGLNLRTDDLLKQLPNFVRMLEDTNGDGVFDKSTIFADKMTLPMGALWHRGALYVASPPGVWKLEDTDDDGVADRRTQIVDSFGFSGNAASVHGCFLGPNGRIYWCDGRHGHEFKDEQGNIVSKGLAARIFSCRSDGSDVQTWCGGGMDNPVEIDFTPEGEMFGTVNILHNRPRRIDCLMHWAEAGVYPHPDQAACIAEFRRTGELMPSMTDLGHVAVSGMLRYRSEQFGSEYRNNVFTTIFNLHKVIRSTVTRSGASFQTQEEDFFVDENPDSHPTDVVEDADGSLLVVDTGGWFRIGCPQSQIAKPDLYGSIYRIRRNNARRVDDPRGLALDLKSKSAQLVASHLNDERPAVREQAIDILAQQGPEAIDALTPIVSKHPDIAMRRNAVWALSRIETEPATALVRAALNDREEGVRIAAARSAGTLRDAAAADVLLRMVSTDTPAVRRQAATALGQIRMAHGASGSENQETLAALFEAIPSASQDRHLEHALIFAAIRISDRGQTIPFLSDANPHVRRAALIVLDRIDEGNLTRELVTPLLDTDDPRLQQQTLAVISRHAGWAQETQSLLKQWLNEPKLDANRAAILRGFLLSQAEDREIQNLVAGLLNAADAPTGSRLLLLEVIARAQTNEFPAEWAVAVKTSLKDSDPAVQLQSVRITQAKSLASFDVQLLGIAEDPKADANVRVEAVIAVVGRMSALTDGLFEFLTGRIVAADSPLDRMAAARALADAELGAGQLLELTESVSKAGPVVLPTLIRAFAGCENTEVGAALVVALGKSDAAGELSAHDLTAAFANSPTEVRTSAKPLFERLAGQGLAQQKTRLAELAHLTSGGDASVGRKLFFSKKAVCSSCHTVAGEGEAVGPDLTQIGGIRTPGDLLEAIAFPSASFARGYRPFLVATLEGKVHAGIISRQTTDALVLRTPELAEIRIPRENIDEVKESNVSIMPKGIDKTLTEEELRHLVAYLAQLR